MVLTLLHIGSVTICKQCMTVDLFPNILANAVDIQKEHLLLHTPVLNKTPSCIYTCISVPKTLNQYTLPLVPGCILVLSILDGDRKSYCAL